MAKHVKSSRAKASKMNFALANKHINKHLKQNNLNAKHKSPVMGVHLHYR
ncbi:Uncharacterised protein [Neisseria animaloris]|uniref:Uncharacterized protein n=1 Tax=Neisseria animaloris TaxID=326522 RepID=A0A448U992_9NEIS|nr:Uncharacterised protein [Neisseria animaloris]